MNNSEKEKLLKPYYHKVHAVRITRENYPELKALDIADGVLSDGPFEDYEGDWFVEAAEGYSLYSGGINLIPVWKLKGKKK